MPIFICLALLVQSSSSLDKLERPPNVIHVILKSINLGTQPGLLQAKWPSSQWEINLPKGSPKLGFAIISSSRASSTSLRRIQH
ncbi:hypothetical protein V8C34DRAFT_296112 [Trichoderma compactum]